MAAARVAPPRTRWRIFYALVGSLAVTLGAINALGPIQGALSGCTLRIEALGIRVQGSPNCFYAVDVGLILIPAVAGVIVLLGAWRYGSRDLSSVVLTSLTIPVTIALAAFPLYTVWWLYDFYRLSVGPVEIIFFAIAAAVLALAVWAGWRTAQYLLAPTRLEGGAPPH